MDGPTDYQTKQTKSEIKRQTSYGVAYMWHLKHDTNEVIYKKCREQICDCQRWGAREGWTVSLG